jgi:diacylglycerol kinase (ATP)
MKSNLQKSSPSASTNASASYVATTSIARPTKVSGSAPLPRQYAWQVASNLLVSFRYAWAGVRYAFASQRNFRIHTLITVLAINLGLWLKVTPVEMAMLTLTCALVLVLELLNTALESVVDLAIGQSYHELAKIAKDCAAGAVLIASIAAILVASFIFLPLLLPLF